MIKKLYQYVKDNFRELVVYFIVGVTTTVVSWGACFVVERFLLDSSVVWQNAVINTIGWLVGVLYSYPMSRWLVFKSKNPKWFREFLEFVVSRLSTWFLDIAIMYITVNLLKMDYWIAKLCISAVIVTILNYVFSKLIFSRKKNKKGEVKGGETTTEESEKKPVTEDSIGKDA